jgi:hypothetical protein
MRTSVLLSWTCHLFRRYGLLPTDLHTIHMTTGGETYIHYFLTDYAIPLLDSVAFSLTRTARGPLVPHTC